MRQGDRLLAWFGVVLRAAAVLNYVSAVFFVGVLAATVPAHGLLAVQLARKYGPTAPLAMNGMRGVMLAALVAVVIVARLLRALLAIAGSVRAGDPFVAANACRLRTVGWMLLALQLLDLGWGLSTLWFRAHHIDIVDWQPSFTGWLAVLVAFVLARVFTLGAAMRDDLATVV